MGPLFYFFLNIYIETVSHSGTQEHLRGSTGMNHELYKILKYLYTNVSDTALNSLPVLTAGLYLFSIAVITN